VSGEEDDVIDSRVRESWAATPAAPPGARERLHATLAATAPPRRTSSALSWWLRPFTVRIRPAWALAITAALAAAVFVLARAPHRSALDRHEWASNGIGARPVEFVLVAPSAQSVALVGDFNAWDPAATPMLRTADAGVWRMRVTLAPGLHLYGFVVDGRDWVTDPNAPLVPADLYGSRNSVVVGGEL
jgi:Carbohydrate-binding module 48 (Isoamylase N-terminal domain)